jgi:glycosyltransferase involved in cell wall biosynthesis
VASDIPGYREVLDPQAAIAVEPDDPSALVEAVAALVDDEPRRQAMGEAGRTLAVERYGWDRIAIRLIEIYERVTGVRPGEAKAA